jgi:hypothetical protein
LPHYRVGLDAPSDEQWEKGDILSLDSGGNYQGYIGDPADAIRGARCQLEDLLGEIEDIQRAAMKPTGERRGKRDLQGVTLVQRKPPQPQHSSPMAWAGQPRGATATASGPVPYDAYDADRPLESGMVVSVETTLAHPERGFIKLEDTVVVTPKGFDIYGAGGRGWNRRATAAR